MVCRQLVNGSDHQMEAVIAAVAFIGLFTMWVVLPRKLLRK